MLHMFDELRVRDHEEFDHRRRGRSSCHSVQESQQVTACSSWRMLDDLKAKAKSQFAEARQTEAAATHNFWMLQQSLEDEMMFNAPGLEDSRSRWLRPRGQVFTDNADLMLTEDALAENTAALEDLQAMTGKSRGV